MSEARFHTDCHFDCLGILKQSSDLNGGTNCTYWWWSGESKCYMYRTGSCCSKVGWHYSLDTSIIVLSNLWTTGSWSVPVNMFLNSEQGLSVREWPSMWEVSSSIPLCDFELLFRLFSFLCSFKYLPVKQGTDWLMDREKGWGKVGGKGVGVSTLSASVLSV